MGYRIIPDQSIQIRARSGEKKARILQHRQQRERERVGVVRKVRNSKDVSK